MDMPGRKWVYSDYRYEFNGKEKNNETFAGADNFGMREYDERLGRFFSRDPLAKYLPNKTPYAFAGNSPITFIDKNGGFQIVPEICGVSGKKLDALIRIAKSVSILANENGGDNDFVKTFMARANVSKEKAMEILSFGTGPMVITKDPEFMVGKNGGFDAGLYLGGGVPYTSEFVYINNDVLDDDGNGNDYFAYLEGMITLWHEGIHYGDELDHLKANGEPGNLAESDLFGFMVGRKNLSEYAFGVLKEKNGKMSHNPNIRPKAPGNIGSRYYLGDYDAIKSFYQGVTNQKVLQQYNKSPSYTIDLKVAESMFNKAESVIKTLLNGGSVKNNGSHGNDRDLDAHPIPN